MLKLTHSYVSIGITVYANQLVDRFFFKLFMVFER